MTILTSLKELIVIRMEYGCIMIVGMLYLMELSE